MKIIIYSIELPNTMTANYLPNSAVVEQLLNDNRLPSFWNSVQQAFIERYGSAIFKSWFSIIEVIEQRNQYLILGAPTSFTKDWIQAHYLRYITQLCQQYESTIKHVELIVKSLGLEKATKEPIIHNPAPRIVPPTAANFGAPLNAKYTFSNFVVGKPNELAFAAAQQIAQLKSSGANPLLLWGHTGLGKTHLMHAIAWHIKQHNAGYNILYMSAEKFMYHFIRALQTKEVLAFKEMFRVVDMLLMDDIQFICGKASTQEEFFHTLNTLMDSQKQVIISSSVAPSKLSLGAHLKSRLSWGLTVDLHDTTYELRLAILRSKASQLKLQVSNEILEFLADKIVSNVRELEGALNKVAAHTSLIGHTLSLSGAKDLLGGILIKTVKRIPSIQEIQHKVCAHYEIQLNDLLSNNRSRAITKPRQIAMYLAKQLTTKSLLEISQSFNKKDHTTIMHAIENITKLQAEEPELNRELKILTLSLQTTQ